MPNSLGHLTEWTLEQLAEGTLPEAQQAVAAAHLDACRRCAAELEGYRSLFAALSEMPRFAPSPGFSDAVLTRVRMAPEPAPWLAWVQRRLPSTRRGWAILSAALVAPALPVLALMAWLLSRPLVSAATLWQWTVLTSQQFGRAAVATLLSWGTQLGVVGWAQAAYAALLDVPLVALAAVVIALAIVIPLSAWSLVRLIRTPTGNITYAN